MAQGSGGISAPSFSQVENSLRNVALQMGSIVSLQQQLSASLTAWRELERELALARAAAGGTASEFKEMEKAAREFSLSSTYSAGQVANAFYGLASAGFTVRETLQAATGVILLAQATLTDLGEASDVTASALSQFSLSAMESYRVSNLFVASTNASLSSVPKLSYALRQVGPIANQAGLSIEETVAALDKLFDAGLRGEQAGTALRNSIARLISPMGDGAKALDALGVSIFDQTGNMRNLLDVMEEISKLNLSTNEVVSIVGIEAASGFLALMKEMRTTTNDGTNALRAHQKEITNTDWAYQQAVVQLNTLDGALHRAGNNFNDIRIQLGQQMAPVMVELANLLQDVNTYLSDTSVETKLNATSNVLWATSMAASYFGLSRIGGAAESFAKNSVLMRDGITGATLAVSRGAGTMTDRLGAAGGAVSNLSKGLMGLGGTVVGIAAVTAGVYALARAASEAAEAANRARTENVTGNLLERMADLRGKEGANRDAYLTEPVDLKAYRQQLVDISKRGSDPFAVVRQLNVFLETGENLFDIQRQRLNDLENNSQETRAAWESAFNAMADVFQSTASGFVSLQTEADIISQIEGAAGTEAAFDFSNLILSMNRKYLGVGKENVKQLVQQNTDQLVEAVRSMNALAPQERLRLIREIEQNTHKLMQEDAEALAGIMNILAEESAEAQQYLAENPEGRSQYGWMSEHVFEVIRYYYDQAATRSEQEYVLTEEQMRGKIAKMRSDLDNIRALQDQAREQLPEATQRLRASFEEFVLENSNLAGEDFGRLQELLSSPQMSRIMDQAVDDMAKQGTSLRDGLRKVIEEAQKQKLQSADLLMDGAEELLAIALFGEREATLLRDKAEVQLQEAMLNLAKLQGDPSEVRMARELANRKGVLEEQVIISDFLNRLSSSSGEQGKKIVSFVATDVQASATFNRAIKDFTEGRKSRAEAVNSAFEALVSGDTSFRNTPGLRLQIEAMMLQAEKNDIDIQAEIERINKDADRKAKSNLRTDPTEKYVLDLLNLPSAEELRLQARRYEVEAQYALAEFFNFPIERINKALDTAEIEFRQRRIEIQRRFGDVYSNTLAQGADGIASNAALREAFSGDIVAKILGEGAADVFGTQITREAIRTAEGMQQFVDIVISKFGQAVAGQPAAEQRIDAARRMVIGMLNEFIAAEADISAKLETLNLERQKVEAEINSALYRFQADNFIAMFENMASQSGLSGELAFDVEIALQAEVIRVQLDAQRAKDKVTDEFRSIFSQLDIPIGINAEGVLEPYERGANTAVGAVAELLRMGNSNPSGTTNDPIVVRMQSSQQDNSTAFFPLPEGTFRTSSGYGNRTHPVHGGTRFHDGVDLAAPAGTPVGAMFGGTVVRAGQNGGYGNYVELEHENGLRTFYAHLNSIAVEMGQSVARGMMLGEVGSTGTSTGPHLHTGAKSLVNGKWVSVDPSRALQGAQTGDITRVPFQPQDPGSVRELEITRELTEEQRRQLEVLMAGYRERMEAIDALAARQIDFITDSENAEMLMVAAIQEYRMASWDDYEGKVLETMLRVRDMEFELADAAVGRAADNVINGGTRISAGIRELNDQIQSRLKADNAVQAQERINDLRRLNEEYRSYLQLQIATAETDERRTYLSDELIRLNEDEAASIEEIRDALDRKNVAVERDINMRRALSQQAGDLLEQRATEASANSVEAGILGMKASVIDFYEQLPTIFETTRQVVGMSLMGMADSVFMLFERGGKETRKFVADTLMAMSQLMVKMLAMYAIMQLISAIPGGAALLQSLGWGGGLISGRANSAGGRGDAGSLTTIATAGAFAQGGLNGPTNRALFLTPGQTGVAPIMTAYQRAKGGIRPPHDPAISVFGEGDNPEAYIPMLDRQTIPVMFDNNGKPFIPLPSGERIPVSMQTQMYAKGGTNGRRLLPPSIPATRAAVMSANDAAGSHRSVSSITRVDARSEHHISVPITLNGSATEEDAEMVSEALIARVLEYFAARDAENNRQLLRNRGDLLDSYGVRG